MQKLLNITIVLHKIFFVLNDRSEKKYLVFGKNEERLEFNLARCCNPIQGDKVFGFVTVDRGIFYNS